MRKKSAPLYSLAGVLMALTLFTKWHHGVFVIFSVVFTQISVEKKLLSRSNGYLLLPFLLLMAGWFAHPQHVTSFYGHATFQPEYFRMWSLDNLLFYPKSFFQIYHASPIVALMVSAAFLLSLRHVRDPRIRLFLCHVAVGLIMMTMKLDNRHRYIITIVPSAWILAGNAMVRLASRWPGFFGEDKRRLASGVAVLILLALASAFPGVELYGTYAKSLQQYSYWSDERPNVAYEFVAEKNREDEHIAVFGTWDYYNSLKGATIRWAMEASRFDDEDAAREEKERAQALFVGVLRNRDGESGREFTSFLERKDVRVDEYHLLSFMRIADEERYLAVRDAVIVNPFSDKIVDPRALAPDVTSAVLLLREGEEEVNGYAEEFMNGNAEWVEYARERFPTLGIVIRIFKKPGVVGKMN